MKKTRERSFGPTLSVREQQMDQDYEWCLHDPEVRKKYGGQVVVVHQRKIWGVGSNHAAALAAAQRQPGCPPRHELAIVVVPERPVSTDLQ